MSRSPMFLKPNQSQEFLAFENGIPVCQVWLAPTVDHSGTTIQTEWQENTDRRALACQFLLIGLAIFGQQGIIGDSLILKLMRRFREVAWEEPGGPCTLDDLGFK